MSLDFTFVFACHAPALEVVFQAVDQHLRAQAFRRDREVVVSNGRDASVPEQEKILLIDNLVKGKALIQQWRSVYMEYHSPQITLGIQFDSNSIGVSSGLIYISKRTMYSLHKDRIPISFYELITSIAVLIGATGGYGGFQAEEGSETPEQVLAEVLAKPANRELWFDIVVIPRERLSNTQVESAWCQDFERVEQKGFIFFINREYLELCRDFG